MTSTLTTFLKHYKKSLDLGATDFLITPVFDSKLVVLDYVNGKLKSQVPKDVISRSGIREDLFEGLATRPAFFSTKRCSIVGHRIYFNNRKWFIAEEILSGSERTPLGASLPLQLHFLAERKFLTVRPLMSWFSVIRANADGSPKSRPLPHTKTDTQDAYQKRLTCLQQVLVRQRATYWHPDPKLTPRGRVLPVEAVTGLRIAYSTLSNGKLLPFSLGA